MDINDSYYPDAANDFPIVTSRKWMNGLNKVLNETTNLVKKATPLVHCSFVWYFIKCFYHNNRTSALHSVESSNLSVLSVCVKLTQ